MNRDALVLIGSPKGIEKSASARVSLVLTELLETAGWSVKRLWLYDADEDELLTSILSADLIILSSPLYFDSLPAPVIRRMEVVVEKRRRTPVEEKAPRFVSILNCGFVEPKHNETAQRICRRFASRARFEWYGSISLGCAGAMRRRIRRGLIIAGEALSKGFPVPPKVKRLTKKPLIPRLAYIVGGNVTWRRIAKKNGLSKGDLLAQPYKPRP